MIRKLFAPCLALAGVLCGVLALEMRAAVAQTGTQVADSYCYTGDCTSINWTTSTPYDPNGNPLPQGALCLRAMGLTVSICADQYGSICNSTGVGSVCPGMYLDPRGKVIPCHYQVYNC